MSCTRDDILKARVKVTSLDVPDLGTVHIRPLSVAALSLFMDRRDGLNAYQLHLLLAALSISDAEGYLLFTEADLPALGELPMATLKLVVNEVIKVNNLGVETEEGRPKNSSPAGPSAPAASRLLSGSA